jgi:hypothetical protein
MQQQQQQQAQQQAQPLQVMQQQQAPPPKTPQVVTSRTLLLSTANRESGDPWDASFSLDHGIRCDPDNGGYITVTPTFMSMRRSWDVVRPVNNRITLRVDGGGMVGRDVFLPVGSGYSVLSLRTQLERLFTELTVEYDPLGNRFTFTPKDATKVYRLSWYDSATARFLGMNPKQSVSDGFTTASPLTSRQNVSVSPNVVVVISTDLPTFGILDTFTHSYACQTGVLLVVPVDAPAYGEIVYRAPTPATSTQRCYSDVIRTVRLRVSDEAGRTLPVDDYIIGLRLDVYGV